MAGLKNRMTKLVPCSVFERDYDGQTPASPAHSGLYKALPLSIQKNKTTTATKSQF